MARGPWRLLLVVSAYSPLMVIIAVRVADRHPAARNGLLLMAFISVTALLVYIGVLRREAPTQKSVALAVPATPEVLSYMMTYLFPFLDSDFSEGGKVFSLVCVYIVVLIIQVRANLIHVNPILFVIGYHLMEITLTEERKVALITRRPYIPPNSTIMVAMAGDHVFLEVGEK